MLLRMSYGRRIQASMHKRKTNKQNTIQCKKNRNNSNASTKAAINAEYAPGILARIERLEQLQQLLAKHSLTAYIIPSDDPHLCETPPASFRRREWISGFTGSAGTALVTIGTDDDDGEEVEEEKRGITSALLWTDGRYFLQAENELEGTPWELMRSGMPNVPTLINWLTQNLVPGSQVGVDPMVFTLENARQYKEALSEVDCEFVSVQENLVDTVWEAKGRPAKPSGQVRIHPIEYAGEDIKAKLERLREEMKENEVDALLVSTLDEVAWLFNIRGGDVENSPVTVAYALLTETDATLYVDLEKVSDDVRAHLEEAGGTQKEYTILQKDLQSLCKEGKRIWIDPAQCTYGIYQTICEASKQSANAEDFDKAEWEELRSSKGEVYHFNKSTYQIYLNGSEVGDDSDSDKPENILEKKSPISSAKAIKNKAEIDGFIEAHLRDGAALVEFLHYVEKAITSEGKSFSEYELAGILNDFRSKQSGFIEPSFPTIAGEGAHGAIIHYRAEESTSNQVSSNSMLLLDSGGQYDCGTTDVTRTMHYGEPTEFQRECFTRVLKGHIGLGNAIFPVNTPGFMIDSFARSSLWKAGLDYRHGTGHGVGAALNVHEGPQGISARYTNTTGLAAGMVVSNEPGYYEDGAFGIRIENLVSIAEADTSHEFGGKKYLCFNNLTMVPIQKSLIVTELLTKEELNWLNDYHKKVWEVISPRITEAETKSWLRDCTLPL